MEFSASDENEQSTWMHPTNMLSEEILRQAGAPSLSTDVKNPHVQL